MKPTYVLFVPNRRPPSVRHDTLESARTEAKRLLTDCAAPSVLVCEVIEGLERVVREPLIRKLKKNPLPKWNGEPIF